MVLVFSQTQISNVVKVIISKIPAFPSKRCHLICTKLVAYLCIHALQFVRTMHSHFIKYNLLLLDLTPFCLPLTLHRRESTSLSMKLSSDI